MIVHDAHVPEIKQYAQVVMFTATIFLKEMRVQIIDKNFGEI
jgi:hypothetical protein